MLLDRVNLNHLRLFESVYRNRSMTKAAEELFLTQSGVSQHIKNLEETLQVKLFDRIKHRLIPTDQAKKLHGKFFRGLLEIEGGLEELATQQDILTGTIAIGLPVEFGNHIILPLLSEFGCQHPWVKFAVSYGAPREMEQEVLRGDLDLAIVDNIPFDPAVKSRHLCNENLHLCTAKRNAPGKKLNPKKIKKYFEELSYIQCKSNESIINTWFKHHYGFQAIKLKIKAVLTHTEGVTKLVSSGLGASILPLHTINMLSKKGEKIHVFQERKKPLVNKISMIYLEREGGSRAVHKLRDYLGEEANFIFT